MGSLRMKLSVGLGLLGLFAIAVPIYLIWGASQQLQLAERYRLRTEAAGALLDAAGQQAIERGSGASLIASRATTKPAGSSAEALDAKRAAAREQSQRFVAASQAPIQTLASRPENAHLAAAVSQWREQMTQLETLRSAFDRGELSAAEWIRGTTAGVQAQFAMCSMLFTPTTAIDKAILYNTTTRMNVAGFAEAAGVERATMSALIAAGKPIDETVRNQLAARRAIQEQSIQFIRSLETASSTPESLRSAIGAFNDSWNTYTALRQKIDEAGRSGKPYEVDSATFFSTATAAIDSALKAGAIATQLAFEADAEMATVARREFRGSVTTLVVAVLLVTGLCIFISRGLVSPLLRTMSSLRLGAQQVQEASGVVSSAAQNAASGATTQATTLETASKSLNTMLDFAKSNVQAVKTAATAADEARRSVQAGNQITHQLTNVTTALLESSEQVGKIISLIESIAFQTNLLALNAAVEAARAGESGKGFAVVAEEVRALAKRCADAAKQTSELISRSTEQTREGAMVSTKVNDTFQRIDSTVNNVNTVLDEINTSSQRQAGCADELREQLSVMDGLTTRNAANAEETAAAAEELNSMSVSLKDQLLGDLVGLVIGNRRGERRAMLVAPATVRSEDGAELARGYTHNISRHGIGLQVDQDLSQHGSVVAEVKTDDGSTHQVRTKVVRSESRPGSKFYVGAHVRDGHSIPHDS